MVMNVGEDCMELMLVGLLRSVEFDDSALKNVEEIKEKVIIGLLLVTSGKTGVYRHWLFLFIHKRINLLIFEILP